jgi:hypothetical protein
MKRLESEEDQTMEDMEHLKKSSQSNWKIG